MNFFEKIGKSIGHFFVGIFNAAKKAYKNLSPEDQTALRNGAGIVSLINEMTFASAAEIRAALIKEFPNIDEAKLEAAIFAIAKHFNLIESDNLDEVIDAIKEHLSKLEGKAWALASHAAAAVAAGVFGDPATKVAVFVSLLEWVYQTFIKKAV